VTSFAQNRINGIVNEEFYNDSDVNFAVSMQYRIDDDQKPDASTPIYGCSLSTISVSGFRG
jgi:hypothetical protein